MNLPIFPLPIYLLPGGITRLRIFEQRYLNMVKNINETNGFAICYSNQGAKTELAQWGSWVDIIDFEQGSDGVLVIDVQCQALVDINDSSYDDNNLLQGSVSVRHHWSADVQTLVVEHNDKLTFELKRFFSENKELSSMYQNQFNSDIQWVCARWLELIPVSFANKALFADMDSFPDAIKFLSNIIGNKPSSKKYLNKQ